MEHLNKLSFNICLFKAPIVQHFIMHKFLLCPDKNRMSEDIILLFLYHLQQPF
jgi:hypothetical protein